MPEWIWRRIDQVWGVVAATPGWRLVERVGTAAVKRWVLPRGLDFS